MRPILLALLAFSSSCFISCFYSADHSKFELDLHGKHLKVYLEARSATLNIIHADSYSDQKLVLADQWNLPFPVYHFECADVNDDSIPDLLVGVIKPTRFDSVVRKRIFIFKLVDGYIRPLWLGSRVGQPLEDFKVVKHDNENFIRTIEQEQDGNFLVADYRWKTFGLEFTSYLQRDISKREAIKKLTTAP